MFVAHCYRSHGKKGNSCEHESARWLPCEDDTADRPSLDARAATSKGIGYQDSFILVIYITYLAQQRRTSADPEKARLRFYRRIPHPKSQH